MNDLFASSWEKLARVEEQISQMEREVDGFLDEPPFGQRRVVYSIDEDAHREAMQIHAGRQVSLRFGVLTGEILHNLRSALDHLAAQLVLVSGAAPTKRTAFPLFIANPNGDRGREKRFEDAIRGMSERDRAIVRQLQPYDRMTDPEEDPLAILAELCNRDKHRELNVAVLSVAASGKTYFFRVPPGSSASSDESSGHLAVDIGGSSTAEVCLEKSVGYRVQPVTGLLRDLLEEVRDVIAIFSSLYADKRE